MLVRIKRFNRIWERCFDRLSVGSWSTWKFESVDQDLSLPSGSASVLQGLHLPYEINTIRLVLRLRSLRGLLEIINNCTDLAQCLTNLVHGGRCPTSWSGVVSWNCWVLQKLIASTLGVGANVDRSIVSEHGEHSVTVKIWIWLSMKTPTVGTKLPYHRRWMSCARTTTYKQEQTTVNNIGYQCGTGQRLFQGQESINLKNEAMGKRAKYEYESDTITLSIVVKRVCLSFNKQRKKWFVTCTIIRLSSRSYQIFSFNYYYYW